ncbi:ATP-binding protein [Vibrio sp.]|uniref:ATP-binding protein n=1 Tax=Vibrio sp. TaxID=678 RepID=UPI003D12AE5B
MALSLILIRGLPGSGKSTLAKTLPAIHIEADMYFINEQGDYCYRPEALSQAHTWCQQQTEYWLARGESVVVANTFVRQWEMDAYRQLAQKYQALLEIKVCRGQFDNIHHVDTATVARMRKQWQE